MKTQTSRQTSRNFARYLPIDDALFASPVFLTSAGRTTIPPGAAYPPPGHPDLYQFKWRDGRVLPEFSLLWVEAGAGVWETRGGSFPIRAGQVGQVLSGQWHRYRPDPAIGWTECWVQFNGRLAHELEADGHFPAANPVSTPGNPRLFARQLLEFLRDIAAPDFRNDTAQGLRLLGLLGVLRDATQTSAAPARGLIENARQHIWSHSHRQLNVAEVAEHLGVSRRTLERAFTTAGLPGVLEEITRCRLNRAERLLRETRLPVQHIVSLAGFGTAEQMRLQFQARHNRSPSAYRKTHQAG
ncbi:MAG: AraC family transcriptional regulator [Verrucomicrobia bacterium]|nr:AraC family transcriptional regulator [Verrucomicrobiota bacterium]